ncbi:MAG: hypothetical protein WDN45_19095 [Caulobacteraceae bacterium]
MKSFLDAGFTTVFSMGDDPKILELRRRLNSGEIAGPTLYSALIVPLAQGFPQPAYPVEPSPYADPGRTDPARPPNRPVKPIPGIPDDATRATIRQAKQAGYDAIKTILVNTPGGPEPHTLAVIVDEAHKQGLRVFTHATAVEDSITAVNAHVDVLAHTPHIAIWKKTPRRATASSPSTSRWCRPWACSSRTSTTRTNRSTATAVRSRCRGLWKAAARGRSTRASCGRGARPTPMAPTPSGIPAPPSTTNCGP